MRDEAVITVRDLARSSLTDSAVSVCMQALRVSEDDAVLECLLARLMFELRGYPEAIAAASRAIDLDPVCAPAHLVLGCAYDRQGGVSDRSLLVWDDLAGLAPENAAAQVQLGEALLAAGLAEEATAAWERAIALEPGYTRPVYLRAIMALEREGITSALPELQKAAELDRGQDRLFFALAGFDVAETLPASATEVPADRDSRLAAAGTFALLEEYFPAADLVRLALADDPDDTEAMALAAYCYLKQEAFTEAVACALRAIAVKPRTPSAVYVLGTAFAKRPALAGHAVRVFAALAKAVPDHPMPHILLGEARLGGQAYDEAGGSFRAALELDPTNVRARFDHAAVLLTQNRHAEAGWQVRAARDHDLERRELFWTLFDRYFTETNEGGEA